MLGIRYRHTKKRWIGWAACWALLLLAALLAGCSSGSKAEDGNYAATSAGMSGGGAAGSSLRADRDTSEVTLYSSAQSLANSNAAPPEAGESGAGGLATSAFAMQDKIIYSATLTMKVADLKETSSELRNAIHQSEGYILQFNDTRHDGEIGANYTIKVPAAGFMSFVDRIGQLPNEKFEQSISGKDVSEEYVDLESRLKAKHLVEERLLGMMDKATRADDLLQFSNQLASVQEEIEQIKGRVRYLDSNVAYSTVQLRVYQTNQTLEKMGIGEGRSFGSKLSGALSASTKAVLNGLELLLIVLVGALPVIAVLAVAAIPVWWIVKYRNKRKAAIRTSGDRNESSSEG